MDFCTQDSGKIHRESDNPSENAADIKIMLEDATETIHREMPLRIHDDFPWRSRASLHTLALFLLVIFWTTTVKPHFRNWPLVVDPLRPPSAPGGARGRAGAHLRRQPPGHGEPAILIIVATINSNNKQYNNDNDNNTILNSITTTTTTTNNNHNKLTHNSNNNNQNDNDTDDNDNDDNNDNNNIIT